jgi:hypothetical protein
MKHRISAPLAASVSAALAAGVLGLASPVAAAERTFEDARGDVAHGVDLHSVKVVNEKNVRLVIQHRNLRPSFRSGAGMTAYLDTDRTEKGPEFAFTGGLFDGTDYALVRTDGWKLAGHVTNERCSYRMRLDYAEDVTRVRMSRACLAKPDGVRVAVRAGGQQADGDQVTDWLTGRREWTRWVAQG